MTTISTYISDQLAVLPTMQDADAQKFYALIAERAEGLEITLEVVDRATQAFREVLNGEHAPEDRVKAHQIFTSILLRSAFPGEQAVNCGFRQETPGNPKTVRAVCPHKEIENLGSLMLVALRKYYAPPVRRDSGKTSPLIFFFQQLGPSFVPLIDRAAHSLEFHLRPSLKTLTDRWTDLMLNSSD